MRRVEGGGDRPAAGFRAPPLLRLVPLHPEPPEPEEIRWLARELEARLGTRVSVEAAVAAEERWMAPGGSQLSSGAIVDALVQRYPAGAPARHSEGDASSAPAGHSGVDASSAPPSHPEGAAARRRPNGSPGWTTETAWVLALTAADLRGGGRGFVFGEAAQGGWWAVIGTARFGARGDPRFRERLVKEALHEVGHLAGLTHCDDSECLMARSANVAAVDRKGATLCPRCRGRDGKFGT